MSSAPRPGPAGPRARAVAATLPATARMLWPAAVLLTAGLAASASLADGVLEQGDLSVVDPQVTADAVALRSGPLTVVANLVTYAGSTFVVGVLGLALVAWVWLRWKDRVSAVVLAGAIGTTAVLTWVVKHLVGRTRPPAADVVGPLDSSPAFPSGHTLGSTVLLGLLAGLVVLMAHRAWQRWGAVALWVVGSLAVAASRVYLGYHWLTDVLMSLAMGLAVLAATALVVGGVRARRPDWRPGPRREDLARA